MPGIGADAGTLPELPAGTIVVADEGKSRSLGYFVWKRLKRNKSAMVGGAFLIMVVVFAIAGAFLAKNAYFVQSDQVRIPPGGGYWFGTDDLGRDIFSRVFYGAHLTLGTAAASVLLAAAIGIPLGLASAYFGGRFDNVIMRTMDIVLAFPPVLLALAIMAALGFSLQNIVLAIGIVYVPKFGRVVRSAALVERALDYVRAAEALGCSNRRILFLHLLPNCFAPVLVLATLTLATAILEAAALSFLGLGAQPPLPEWGRMLLDGRSAFQTAPHIMLFPGLAIAITVLAVNLLGDGLRDALDVRLGK